MSAGKFIAATLATLGVGAVGVGIFLEHRKGRAAHADENAGAPTGGALPRDPDPVRGRASQAQTQRTDYERIDPMSNVPTLESWRPLFVVYGADVPIEICMAWIAEESNGNPCAIGSTPPAGATQPQEYGLGQLNAQDPSNLAIATPHALRAMCGIGPSRAAWQSVLRPLTQGERIDHMTACLQLIRACEAQIRPVINGWGWGQFLGQPGVADYWQMVKLWHASPALVKVAASIVKALGRAPHSFAEYQSHADAIGLANHLGAGHEGGSRGYLDSVWLNVHRIGQALAHPSVGV